VKPPAFRYYDPRSIDEAVDLLGRLENARPLAGGQSLMAMLNLRYIFPDHLIDLNRIVELAGITREGDEIRIGAMTRQRAIQDSELVQGSLPLLVEALGHVGHRQTRNRGTIGGSLCHLDPAAEQVAVANNLDAQIEITGAQGARALPLAQFTVGFMTPALQPGDLVTAVRFPVPPPGHGYSFVELARRHGDFAIVSAAATLVCDPDGRITRAAVTLGGVGPVPQRLVDAEKILVRGAPGDDCFKEAAHAARSLEALEDSLVPAWYRQKVAVVMVGRCLATAYARATRRGNG
jgi:carbon-monoxide dehydrogenase medium subunit